MQKVLIGIGFFLASTSLFAQVYGDPMCPGGHGFCGPSYYYGPEYNYVDVTNYPSYTDSYYDFYSSYSYDLPTYNNYSANYSETYRSHTFSPSQSLCLPALHRELKQGNSGEDVYTLQDFLHDAGYLGAAPNGYFGPATKDAVRAFQFQKRIPTTGNIGPITLDALNNAICGGDYDAYGNISAQGGDRIINLGRTYEPVFQGEVPTRVVEIPTTVVSANTANIYTNSLNVIPQRQSNPVVIAPQIAPTLTRPASATPVISQNIPAINTNIQYYPYDPFRESPLPLPATLVIGSPLNNSSYNEGETINASWTIGNANVIRYIVTFENTTNRLVKEVATVPGSQRTVSFNLNKELLDYLCGGACDTDEQRSFKFNVTATIAGNHGATSEIKGYANPITVRRPFTYGSGVDLQVSKSPIDSGETIDLLVSTPLGHLWNYGLFGPFTVTIRTICPAGVIATVNGVPCGTYTASQNSIYTYFFPAIKAQVTNGTIVPQIVTFELVVTSNTGQILGTDTGYVIVQKGI